MQNIRHYSPLLQITVFLHYTYVLRLQFSGLLCILTDPVTEEIELKDKQFHTGKVKPVNVSA